MVDLIKKAGRNVLAIPGDIRDEAFCGHLVTQAVKGLGGLDILVNNAGRQQFCESIEELTTEDFDATFKTNVYAMFWITKAAIPHLSPDSVIINTSSVQAYEPSEILLDYAQTKAAIVAFTKSLAKQLAPKGIRVNAVAPGPYWTVLQCCGGQPQERWRNLGQMRRWDALVNRWKSRRFMSPWPLGRTAIRLVRSGVLMGGPEPSNVYDLCVESDF